MDSFKHGGRLSYIGWTRDAWNSWDSLIAGTGANAYYHPIPNGGAFNGVAAYGQAYYSYLRFAGSPSSPRTNATTFP